jgi:hypothetical protein
LTRLSQKVIECYIKGLEVDLMRNTETISVSLRKGLKGEAEKVLKGIGIKMSTYVNVTLQSLVDSQKKTFKEVSERMVEDFAKDVIKSKKK